jgi:hypothetical protein
METLQNEIQKSVQWFAITDIQIYGEISESTREAARVQRVEIVEPDPSVIDYTRRNGRKEGLLYNNRIFFGYIRPSQKRKDEYEVNREWILANFKK